MKSTIIYFLGRIISAIIAFSSITIYSHLTNPSDYGYYSYTISIAYIVNMSIHQWVRVSMTRFYINDDHATKIYKNAAEILFLAINAIMITLALITYFLDFNLDANLLVVSLVVISMSFSDFTLEIFRLSGKHYMYSVTYFLRQALSSAIAISLLIYGYGPYSLFAGIIIGCLLPSIFSSFGHFKIADLRTVKREDLQHLLKFGLPLSGTYTTSAILNNIDTILVFLIAGPAVAGLYALCAELARQLIMVVMEAVNLPAYPLAVRAFHKHGEAAAKQQLEVNFAYLIVISIPAVVGLNLCAGDFADVFLGSRYHEMAKLVMPLIAVSTFLRGLRVFYFDQAFHFAKETGATFVTTLIASVMAVGLGIALIFAMGPVGASISAILASLAAVLLSNVFGRSKWAMPILYLMMLKVAVCSSFMAIAIWCIPDVGRFATLALKVAVGIAVYLIGSFCFNFFEVRGKVMAMVRR